MSPRPPHRPAPAWLRPLLLVLAVLFLLEAWIWRTMAPVIAWIAHRLPFAKVKHAIARFAQGLPPYAALLLFLCPLLLLEPVEGVALWAYAHKQWVLGSLCLVVVKLFGVGLMAFMFQVCEPQLLSIGWFARLAGLFLRLKAWADAEVAPVKAALRQMMTRIRAALADRFSGDSRLWRRISELRRRILKQEGGPGQG